MRGVAALLGCLLAWPAAAQEAADWLARMGHALATLDYDGDLVYAHGGQMESLRVFRASGPEGGRERLISLNGPSREVIRAGGNVVCIGTGAQPTTYGGDGLTPALSATLREIDAGRLERHYALALGGAERIAEREAQLLEIRPRDAFRYGYRLWLERDSGMLLKSVRFGADGRPVEQLMFTRIRIGVRPSDVDLAGPPGMSAPLAATPPKDSERAAGSGVAWRLESAPAGFDPAPHQPRARGAADHRLFGDGLAHVSIYVEPLTRAVPAFSGPASRGAINLHGRVVDGLQITVLGDVPAATVERFAQGVVLPDRD